MKPWSSPILSAYMKSLYFFNQKVPCLNSLCSTLLYRDFDQIMCVFIFFHLIDFFVTKNWYFPGHSDGSTRTFKYVFRAWRGWVGLNKNMKNEQAIHIRQVNIFVIYWKHTKNSDITDLSERMILYEFMITSPVRFEWRLLTWPVPYLYNGA